MQYEEKRPRGEGADHHVRFAVHIYIEIEVAAFAVGELFVHLFPRYGGKFGKPCNKLVQKGFEPLARNCRYGENFILSAVLLFEGLYVLFRAVDVALVERDDLRKCGKFF